MAGSLKASMGSSSGLVARYGGEEFAAIVDDATPDELAELAERLRSEIAGLGIVNMPYPVADVVTSSYCIATCYPAVAEESMDDLFYRADEILHKANSHGRNCVLLY